jgi:hypothetical protein
VVSTPQTFTLTYQYVWGDLASPGAQFKSAPLSMNLTLTPPAIAFGVKPALLFQKGVAGSAAIVSKALSGDAGLPGTWKLLSLLPNGLASAASSDGRSLVISGTPGLYSAKNYQLRVQFTDITGNSTTASVPMMITEPASLEGFPQRIVLFVGVPAHLILPLTAGSPRFPGVAQGGLPQALGSQMRFAGADALRVGSNGLQVTNTGAGINITGTALAPDHYDLGVTAQTTLSTGPVGAVTNANLQLVVTLAGDVNLDGKVDCSDYSLVKSALGTYATQPGYNELADPNRDHFVNVLDLAFVQSNLPKGTVCH